MRLRDDLHMDYVGITEYYKGYCRLHGLLQDYVDYIETKLSPT